MTAATINEPIAPADGWAAPLGALAMYALAAVLLLHPTAWHLAAIWASSSSFHHGFFVAPLAAWMIASAAPRPTAPSSSMPGFVIMLLAGALWLAGRAAGVALMEHIAFVGLLIAGVGVVFGGRCLKAWAFPLAFLFFMVPFGAALAPALQTITGQSIVGAFRLVGAPVAIEGAYITTRAGVFEVAQACAGLRFLLAAVMIAAVFAYASFDAWRKRVLFLAFALALAITANAMRAVLIVFVATLTDKQWAVGPDHVIFGWVIYGFIFVVLFAAGRRYADAGPSLAQERSLEEDLLPPLAGVIPAMAIVAALAVYAHVVIDRNVDRAAPSNLSLLSAPGWRILPPPENWRANFAGADRTASATYVSGERAVYVSFGLFTHDRRGAEIVIDRNRAFDGAAWRKIGADDAVVYVFGRSENAPFEFLAGPGGQRLASLTAYWLDGEIYNRKRRVKLAQMQARLKGHNPQGGVIVIAAPYVDNPGDAVVDIRAFATAVEPLARWLDRNQAR